MTLDLEMYSQIWYQKHAQQKKNRKIGFYKNLSLPCIKEHYQEVKRQPGEGNGNPLQYSCLENPVDRGAWWAAVHGVTQSQRRLKRLSMHACIGEGNGNPLQHFCLETPVDRGAWWAAVYGVAQSWAQLKWLSMHAWVPFLQAAEASAVGDRDMRMK